MPYRALIYSILFSSLTCHLWGFDEGTSCPPLSSKVEVLDCYLKKGKAYFDQGLLDSAIQLMHNMEPYTKGLKELEADRLYLNSLIYQNLSAYDSSYLAATESAKSFLELELYHKAVVSYGMAGSALREKGELDNASEYYFKAINLAEEHGVDSLSGEAYLNLSVVFLYLDDVQKQEEFILKAYQNARQYNKLRLIGMASMGLVQRYRDKGQLDSANYYAQQALESSLALNNQQLIGYAYLNLAMIAEAEGRWEQGTQYFIEITNNDRIPPFDRARFLYFYGEFLMKRKQPEAAKIQYEWAYKAAKALNGQNLQHTVGQKLVDLYGELGEYEKGYEIAKEYIALNDTIYEFETEGKIRELNTKYDTAEKEKALQEEALKVVSRTNQRNLFMIFTLGLLIIGGLVLYGIRRRLKLIQQLRLQEAQIAQQQMEQLQQEQKYTAIQAMVAGEEAERSRLARELHDGLGGMLSNIKLTISSKNVAKAFPDMQNSVAIVDKASKELRRIAQNLMPESLARFGLILALEDFVSEVQQSNNLHIDFQYFDVKEPLPDSLTLPVYRVVQELIHNVIKHAKAKEVILQLIQRDDKLYLTVEDDGIGLSWEEAVKSGGHGLKNIETRLAFLKGQLQVDSSMGKGTTINIEITIPTENDTIIHNR